MRIESLVKLCALVLPAIEIPEKKLSFKEKVTWSTMAVMVFLALGGFRLPGAQYPQNSPFYIYEAAVGAKRGTLLELGVAPLLMAHLILTVLVAGKKVDAANKSFQTATRRVLAFLCSIGLGGLLVVSGHYGDSAFGPLVGSLLAFVRPVFACLILGLFDEALAQGYGFSNGVNLMIALAVSEVAVSGAVSPVSVETTTGTHTYGALLAPLGALVYRSDRIQGFFEELLRFDLPNILNLTGTAVALAIIFYYQGFRVEVPIKNLRMRGQSGQYYPIRILQNYFFPLTALIALASSSYFVLYTGKLILGKLAALVGMSGVEDILVSYTNDGRISAGLGYLVAPPRAFSFFAPFALFIYSAAVLCIVSAASVFEAENSSSSSKEVARVLKEKQLTIQGFRDVSLVSVLDRYIPPAARAGGLVLSVAVIISDALGAVGSGAGVVFSAMVVFGIVEIAITEQANIVAMLTNP